MIVGPDLPSGMLNTGAHALLATPFANAGSCWLRMNAGGSDLSFTPLLLHRIVMSTAAAVLVFDSQLEHAEGLGFV